LDRNDCSAKFQQTQDFHVTRRRKKINRNAGKAVVVVFAEEWERKAKRMGTLAQFFASSPLRASGLNVKRSNDKLRSADL
jgi:hypothetical protein